jgi:hypothetical protein
MDTAEAQIQKNLINRYSDVIHEPDGNVSPDFLVNGTIAIEVRRLNQNYRGQSLESFEIPLRQRIEKLLAKFGAAQSRQSYFVFFTYWLPLPNWKRLGPLIEAELQKVSSTGTCPDVEIELPGISAFHLKFQKSDSDLGDAFVVGGWINHNSGGFVVSEMIENLTFVIEEKKNKVHGRYPTWWLAVVDQIGYSLSDWNREEFKKYQPQISPFQKVLIVDPQDPTIFFEIE